MQYPNPPSDPDAADTVHGRTIRDPYRPLEEADSTATRDFNTAQAELFRSFVDGSPDDDSAAPAALPPRLLRHLRHYARGERPTRGWVAGDRRFRTVNRTGLEPQDVAQVWDGKDGSWRTIVDPNTLSDDGTVAVLEWLSSDDGTILAGSISDGGSDWVQVRFWSVATGDESTVDRLDNIKYQSSLEWFEWSGARFCTYTRYPKRPAEDDTAGLVGNQQVAVHRMGQPQSSDHKVFDYPKEPMHYVFGACMVPGHGVLAAVYKGTAPACGMGAVPLRPSSDDLTANPNPFDTDAAAVVMPEPFSVAVGVSGVLAGSDEVVLQIDAGAPRKRLVAVPAAQFVASGRPWDLDGPDVRTVVSQHPTRTMVDSLVVGNSRVLVLWSEHGAMRAELFDGTKTDSLVAEISSTGTGTGTDGNSPAAEPGYWSFAAGQVTTSDRAQLLFMSLTVVTRIIEFDTATGSSTIVTDVHLGSPDTPQLSSIASSWRAFVDTDDAGVRVPVMLAARHDVLDAATGKRISADGQKAKPPVFLYVYGGFDYSLPPTYSGFYATWVQMGGVVALAGLRGGGEYGHDWHQAGILDRKLNTMNDLCAVARWLADGPDAITDASHIAICGDSNGGMVVAATMLMQPHLFGAVLPGVPVADMARFQKFTAGHGWTAEYGSVDDSPEMCDYLLAYSPYHRALSLVERSDDLAHLPAVMINTADHDDRVVPAHALKLAAALQTAVKSRGSDARPVLVRVTIRAGHGAGMAVDKLLELRADRIAFLANTIGGLDDSVLVDEGE